MFHTIISKKGHVPLWTGQRCQLVDLCNLESNHSFDLHKKMPSGVVQGVLKRRFAGGGGVFGVAGGVLMVGCGGPRSLV